MLGNSQRGYAVMSPDMSGIAFEHESFEHCKHYCFNGDVIVEAIPHKCGFSISFRYHKLENWFKIDRFNKVLFKVRIRFEWEYTHKYGPDVLYTNPYNRTESIKKGIIDY